MGQSGRERVRVRECRWLGSWWAMPLRATAHIHIQLPFFTHDDLVAGPRWCTINWASAREWRVGNEKQQGKQGKIYASVLAHHIHCFFSDERFWHTSLENPGMCTPCWYLRFHYLMVLFCAHGRISEERSQTMREYSIVPVLIFYLAWWTDERTKKECSQKYTSTYIWNIKRTLNSQKKKKAQVSVGHGPPVLCPVLLQCPVHAKFAIYSSTHGHINNERFEYMCIHLQHHSVYNKGPHSMRNDTNKNLVVRVSLSQHPQAYSFIFQLYLLWFTINYTV